MQTAEEKSQARKRRNANGWKERPEHNDSNKLNQAIATGRESPKSCLFTNDNQRVKSCRPDSNAN